MNKYLILGFIFLFSWPLVGQELSKEERKEQRRLERQRSAAAIKNMIEDQKFVLEATNLYDKYGQIYPVSSNLNFIVVNGDQAIIQIGSPAGMGRNGVGGITVDGRVTKFEMKSNDKKGNYQARINVMSSVGNFDVLLNVGSTYNASADIRSNHPQRIRYQGKLVPLDNSEIYVGQSSY